MSRTSQNGGDSRDHIVQLYFTNLSKAYEKVFF